MRINSGGSGSAGDTKTYDAESLIAAANARAKHYQTLRSQFHTLRVAFNQIADLGTDFQGKGADAIKKFYAAQVNVVDAWLRMIDKQIAYYHGVAGTIDDKNLGGDTQVQVPFLDEDLSRGYARSKEMVREQRDDIAKILSGISDLVPINVFSNHDVDQALDASEQKRAKMVLDVQDLDQNLTNEYRQVTDDLPYIASLYGELINATRQGADVQPMHFNAQAYHDSKIYQVQDEMKKTTQSYLQYKKQQETVRGMEKQREVEVNRPWYEKAVSAIATFAGELSGYYDYLRAVQGIDPETGRKLSTAERVEAGAMAASTFIPIIGWGGRIVKGGEALYKTARGLEAAGQSLKAYDQASRTLKVLSTSEKGINALLAGNGVIEASTGRDMFGKPLTEEQRKNSLLQGIMMMNAFSRGKLVSNEEKIAVGEQAKAFKEHVNNLVQQAKETIGSHKLKPAMAGASHELSQLTDDVRDVGKTHAMTKADRVGEISEKSGVGVEKSHAAKGIDNANRLIPGTAGNPTSGDPTKLGKNLLESMGLPRSASWEGYQAQHIIPSQLNKHPVIKKIGMDMNDSTNGIFLPIPFDDVSGLSRHRGFHSVYNNVVRKQLDRIDVNQDIAVLEKQVYELQQKLKKGVETGLPLYKTKINNIEEFYKSGKNEKLPIWNRGGGATEELWERWLSK